MHVLIETNDKCNMSKTYNFHADQYKYCPEVQTMNANFKLRDHANSLHYFFLGPLLCLFETAEGSRWCIRSHSKQCYPINR